MKRLAIALLVVAALLAGCGRQAAPPPPGFDLSNAAVGDVLQDAWVSDGAGGYFVDRANAFSLYTTTWEAAIAGQEHLPTGLVPSSVASWVDPALRGQLSASDLPPIAQLDDAVQLLGSTVDKSVVADTLAKLHGNGGYRSDFTEASTDPGATAIALQLLDRFGLPIPSDVATNVSEALTATTPAQAEAAPPANVVTLLQAGAAIPALRSTLRGDGLVPALADALGRIPADPAWLATESTLHSVASTVGLSLPPVSCGSLVGADGQVRLSGQSTPDPQATFYASRLGCTHLTALPAHSRAGWPTADATAAALASTAAAMRVADDLGVANRYAAQVGHEVTATWLPAAKQTEDRANLRLLAAAVGGQLPAIVDKALPAPTVDAKTDSATLLMELAAQPRAPAGASNAVRSASSQSAMVRAGLWQLASVELADPALHQQATNLVRPLEVRPGVYADGSGRKASLTASIIGSWITGRGAGATEDWARAGLLSTAIQLPMAMLASVLDCRADACRNAFPVAF